MYSVVPAVQNVPAWQTEFYALLRFHDFDDDTANYRRGDSFLTGARFSF